MTPHISFSITPYIFNQFIEIVHYTNRCVCYFIIFILFLYFYIALELASTMYSRMLSTCLH